MSTEEPPCGLDAALAVMGGKWKPLILYHLNSGPKRFGDLKRLVAGISEKVLIQQLRRGGRAHRTRPPAGAADGRLHHDGVRHDAGASVDAALRVGDGASGQDH